MHYDKQLILEELQRIRASSVFRTRKQLQAFLSYVIEESIAGRDKEISQYRIAVQGLNKAKDFSPVDNPIVRIEAGRLRKKLAQYYNKEGANNPLIITIPKGSYCPKFSANRNFDANHALHPPFNGDRRKSSCSQGPRILPYFHVPYRNDEDLYSLFCHLAGELPLILTRFSFIEILASEREADEPLFDCAYFQRLWLERRADFVMRFSVIRQEKQEKGSDLQNKMQNDHYEIKCILLKTMDQSCVWSNTFVLPLGYTEKALQAIYYKIISRLILLENGLIHRVWRDHLLSQYENEMIPHHQRVLAHLPLFLSKEALANALHICEQRLQHASEDLVALLAFAFLCIQDKLLQLGLVTKREQRALEACERVLLLDPANAEAHAYYGFWAYQTENPILACTEFAIALKANPFDLSLQALRNRICPT